MASSGLRSTLTAGASAFLVAALMAGSALAAPTKSGGPKAPTNLRVTGVTSYTVSLAWDAATDRTGIISYTVCCSPTSSMTVAGNTTSVVFRPGIEAGRSYSFVVTAKAGSGKTSAPSNSVSATTPADRTPPTKPTLTVTDVGPTSVSLAWSSTDDGPNVWFYLYVDGQGRLFGTRETSANIGLLEPETTHSFVVVARDFGGNTATSDTVSATTEARDPTDTTPPTIPGNLRTNGMAFPDGETWLFWDRSTDDRTPQSLIEYRIFVNGVLNNSGIGGDRDVVYGEPFSQNVYSVVAVDESGNQSAPASITVDNF